MSQRVWIFIFLLLVILAGCSFKKSPMEKNTDGDKASIKRNQLPANDEMLWNAVAVGGLEALQALIEQNPNIDLNAVRKGETALSVALRRGDFEVAAMLMSYGASPFLPLQVGGKSAFESVNFYAARFRSVITSQADLIVAHFSKILINNSSPSIVEFFSRNAIPCEIALDKLREARTKASSVQLNDAVVAILNHELCESVSGQVFERILKEEFFDTLQSYSRDLTILKALLNRVPYVSVLTAESQNLVAVLNPVFLIKYRRICGSPFKDESEVSAWRNELISLFPGQSGIAYEAEVRKDNKIGVSSGRALVADFDAMDKYDERRTVVISLTSIRNFFECEEEL